MSSQESTPNPEQRTTAELRQLLSPEAHPTEHVEALLALGLTIDDLFGLLNVEETDVGLISDEELEAAKENFSEDSRDIEIEKLADMLDAYIEPPSFNVGRRVIDDLRHTAEILLADNDENRPLIGAWLKTPNYSCEGQRPLDQLKVDPLQVQVAAYGQELSDEGKIPDLYGHM